MKRKTHLHEKPCVCISLRRAAQKVTDLYDMALKPAGVSANQYSLLINISRMEGCGTGELAQQVRLEKSTLVRTLQPLLRDGLITDKSLGENRKRRLYLTPAGKEVLQKACSLWSKTQEEIIAKLGKNYEEIMDIFAKIDLLK